MLRRERLAEWLGKDVSRLLGGTAFIFFCRIFGAVVAFFTQILLARWMGAAELGNYVLAYSWLVMLAIIPVGGYTGAAMRFVGQGLADNDHGYVRGFIRYTGKIVVVSSIAMALAGCALLLVLPGFTAQMQRLFLTALAGIPFLALIKFDAGIANASSRFALSFLPNNVFRPLLFLGGIWLVWLFGNQQLRSDSAMAIHLLAIVAVAIPTTLLTHRSTSRLLTPAPPTRDTRVWNRTAFSLLALGLFTGYFPELTVIMIGFFLPSADIGIYNVGYRIAMLISFSLFAVDAFTAPALARHYRRQERGELLRVVQHSTQLRFVLALLAVGFFVVFGKQVLRLFGEEFVAGYSVMVVLALAQLAQAAVGPAVRLLSISGFHNQGLYASTIALVVWILLAALLVPAFGIIGVAVSVFLALTAWSFILRYYVMRHLEIDTLIVARDLQR